MAKEQVLLYHFCKEKKEAIEKICLQLGIKVNNIQVEQYHLPIGILIIGNFETKKKIVEKHNIDYDKKTEEILEEMMIMDGFSSSRMDRFLERIKQAGISEIKLKAIVTEYNKNWNSVQLYQELKAEQRKLQ